MNAITEKKTKIRPFLHCLSLLILSLVWLPLVSQSQSCNETAGQTLRRDYASSLLGQRMVYTVYLPPCYNTFGSPYPVVYLFHGSNDDDNHWIRLGLATLLDEGISTGQIPPFVVVMPFGNVIANRNRFDSLSWGNIFLEELLPDAESQFHISTEARQRAIGGISRGGFWAYQIAFRHPELFSAVGGHSAFFDRYHAPAEFNPLDLAQTADIQHLRLWLDRGKDDFAYEGLDLMDERLRDRGLDYEYRIYPEGQHNNDYWSSHLADYLPFYYEAWQPTFVSPFPTTPPIATLSPSPTPLVEASESLIFYPVAAFPSTQTTLSSEQIQQILAGDLEPKLILTPENAALLRSNEIPLHADTRLIELAQLQATLWRNRDWYSLLPLNEVSLQMRILWVDDVPILDQLENYPFAFGTSHSTPSRLMFSGVTALTRQTIPALDANSLEWAASGIHDYVTAVDVFHMSNEVSFVANCPQSNGDLLGGSSSFCSKPDHFGLFDLLELDVLELTGNHNNDYGYAAYDETFAYYQAQGFQTIGGGQSLAQARAPFIYEENGNRIAFVACNAAGPYYALVNEEEGVLGGIRSGAAACDWDWLSTVLPQLAAETDVLIVTVQYPEVEDYLPLPEQRRDFRRLADLGADIVMGTSAHKPQTYEFYQRSGGGTAFIHYGMGNLYFDQPFWGNMRFFMNTFYVQDGVLRGIEIFPGIIEDLARPRLMSADERLNFLYFMFVEQNGF